MASIGQRKISLKVLNLSDLGPWSLDPGPWTLVTGAKLRGREDITIATWNVRTLRATGKVEELLHEMDRYKLSSLGLCEMRWKKS